MTRSEQHRHKQQHQRMHCWKDILPNMEDIRARATDQFIAAWKNSLSVSASCFTWHETMGYVVVKRDDVNKRVVLSPRVPEILDDMGCVFDPALAGMHPQAPSPDDEKAQLPLAEIAANTCWRPAHARFAVRCQPPYLHKFAVGQLALEIKDSLKERRRILKSRLRPDEMLLSISQFPLLGAETYIDAQGPANGPLLRSGLLSDECLNSTPPFTLEIGGIEDRRGAVPYTAVALFRDKNTEWPFIDTKLPPLQLDYDFVMPHQLVVRGSEETAAMQAEAATSRSNSTASNDHPSPDEVAENSPKGELDYSDGVSFATATLTRPMVAEMPLAKNCLLLDSPLFGIGSGGVLRVALCAADLDEARSLYDQLAPISAILTALTAATPIVRGHLVERDSYWDVQCSTVDDRSAQELGLAPLTTAKGTLFKSRFGSIDIYLGPGPESTNLAFQPKFNDCQYTYDNTAYWKMRDSGVDHLLSQHVSHLFTRDIHYASERMLKAANSAKGDSSPQGSDGQEHFKRFLGCNRQNVCLYPPNTRAGSGWEVELMSMEVQMTDEENAAFITFVVLLSRVIVSYQLNLYLPISLMDQNMARAQKVNAIKDQLFYFRRDVFGISDSSSASAGRILRPGNGNNWRTTHANASGSTGASAVRRHIGSKSPDTTEYIELTIDEIINGSSRFKVTGLLNIILTYLSTMRLEYEIEQKLRRQLVLVSRRASGKLCTLATWMRNFVQNHPDYCHDSVVLPSINYDMLRTMNDIEEGRVAAPELLG
ncbi:glutamate--cysteine ligase [Coemansia sp. RSA 1933]|nr:glutamate--cysteine ligase [Coemansia sp. RSA 1933]